MGNGWLAMSDGLRDFSAAPRRSRFEAALLAAGADTEPDVVVDRKVAAIGAMAGTVVEIGPGPGTNLRYYAPGVQVIAVEPNPAMHDRLCAEARRHDVDLDIRTVHGERMDVADGQADAIVGTLVLCGVDNPTRVITEVKRVLKPGGTYFFYEHVRAPERTMTRLGQRLALAPQRWLLNGCETNRDTGLLLGQAGFNQLQIDKIDIGWSAAWTRTRIIGTATR